MCVECNNKYIARTLLLVWYNSNVKHITYIGEYNNISDVEQILPDAFSMDGYTKESVDRFTQEYAFNF